MWISKRSYNDLVEKSIEYEHRYEHMKEWKNSLADELNKECCKNSNLNKDIIALNNENGYLKALFDSKEDTSVIKYNGKLFRITDRILRETQGEPDELEIDAICVGD